MGEHPSASLPPSYFDQVYEANPDPWDFTTSDYERAKYADTLAHLPRDHYASGFEVGCSIGVFTEALAPFCDQLLSVDVSETALAQARARCVNLPQLRLQRMRIPQDEPAGSFDLVVVSEVGYYWDRNDLSRAIAMLARHQPIGGTLVLVHWTPSVHDYPLTGDQVHEAWLARPEWRGLEDKRRESYRLSVLERISS